MAKVAGLSQRLRLITGWALLVAAVGIFIDAWAGWALDVNSPAWLVAVLAPTGVGGGSIGLIPAYLGVTVGMVGFVIVTYRQSGLWLALLTSVGVLAMFTFWGSYPEHAALGGLGSIAIGIAVLALPSWGRLASPWWVASGVLGIPALARPGINWGPISSFTLLGAAIGVTGAFIIWGSRRALPEPAVPVQPAGRQPEARSGIQIGSEG